MLALARSRVLRSAAFFAIVWATGGASCPDILYQTGFEAPTFTARQTVDGQGGFSVTAGRRARVTVTTSQPASGAQDMLFMGSAARGLRPQAGFFIGTAGIAPELRRRDRHAAGA